MRNTFKSAISRLVVYAVCILCVLLGIALLQNVDYAVAESADFRYGSGTQSDPFLISNAQELDKVRYHREAYFKQTNNIDLSEVGDFVSIGSPLFPFGGHYNGDKYYISNLRIIDTNNSVGLFSFNKGVIENIRLDNVEIAGGYNVGSIVGTNRGKVIGCIVENGIIGGTGAVGGIVGLNSQNGEISECGNKANLLYAENAVVDGKYFGGIVGINNGIVNNAYNQGSINANNGNVTYIGGIAGLNQTVKNTAVIEKTYSIGSVFGKAVGQLVGDNLGEIKLSKTIISDKIGDVAFNSGSISDTESISENAFSDIKTFDEWNDFNDKWLYLDTKYPHLLREYVAVNSIVFNQGQMIEIMPGGIARFETTILPKHSTQKKVDYSLVSGQEIAALDTEAHEIKISANAAVGSIAVIQAKSENKTAELYIKVVKIPVEKITLRSVDNITQLKVAEETEFEATVYPENASNRSVTYSVNSSYAEISNSGKLHINENAPIGSDIVVTATSVDNPTLSDSVTIEIIKTSAEKVSIKSRKEFRVTESLELNVDIYPRTTTNKTVHYEVVSATTKGARVIGNKLYADSVGEVVLRAYVDGIYSDDFTIQVKKEPVTDIIFDTDNTFVAGEQLVLKAHTLPKKATYSEVIYEFAENPIGAEIIDGVLYSNNHGHVRIKAVADGISRYKDITVEKVPVERVLFTCEDSFICSDKLLLSASVLPANATLKNIDYKIIDDTASAQITDGVLTAEHDGEVTVRATADGVYTDIIISVLDAVDNNDKISVQAVAFTCETTFKITEQLILTARVYPDNATYRHVAYSIISDGGTKARIVGNVLFAEIPGVIKVRAESDGVVRDLIINAIKEPVTDIALVNAKSVTVNEELLLKSVVRPANATYKSVRYEVLDNQLGAKIFDGNILTCSKVGDVVVRVYADEIYRDFTIEIAKLAVTDILFDGKEFIHTDRLALNASVYPENATYPSIESAVISGQDNACIENGYLYAKQPGVAVVRFIADGQVRDFEITIKKQPVENIVFTMSDELILNSDYRRGEMQLAADILPSNATYPDITYSVIDTENCVAEILNGRLSVKIDSVLLNGNNAANVQGNVTVKALADGVYRTITITLLRNPVTNAEIVNKIQTVPNEWIVTTVNEFKTSQKMRLEFEMLPYSATYKEFIAEVLSVISDNGETANINNDENYNIAFNNVKLYKKDGVYILEADKPCTIEIRITPYGGDKTFEFPYKVTVEKVATVQLGVEVTRAASDSKVATTVRGNIYDSANCPIENIGAYKDYSKIELQQSSQISLRAFAHAENRTLKASYGYDGYLDLYYKVDGTAYKLTKGTTNKYFTFDGALLCVQETAPVTKSFYLYAKSQYGGAESALTEIVIQSMYILEIKGAHIDSNGLITGLESLAPNDEPNPKKSVQKVHYKIRHTSGILIEKTVITDNPTMVMQLFNPTLKGKFTIEYTVYFNDGNGEYSYTLPGVKEFAGINTTASKQFVNNEWNSVVLFDLASGTPLSLGEMKKVKSLYVYGGNNLSSIKTMSLYFTGDSLNSTDVYLHNIAFRGASNKNAIYVNAGNLKVNAIENASVYGGNGTVGQKGRDAIKCNGAVVFEGNELYIKGGTGGAGAVGSDGKKGADGANGKGTGGDGDAENGGVGSRGEDGGRGNDGLIGGYAVYANSIQNYCSNLQLIGGNGGKGGQGGRGGDGGNGGKGGDEEPWTLGCCAHGGNGGRGGDGGEGGNGGSGQNATNVSVNNAATVSKGTAGAKGKYGRGGNGGKGGNGGASDSWDRGGNAGNGGDGGNGSTAGIGGAPGTPGTQSDGDEPGNSGSYGAPGKVI